MSPHVFDILARLGSTGRAIGDRSRKNYSFKSEDRREIFDGARREESKGQEIAGVEVFRNKACFIYGDNLLLLEANSTIFRLPERKERRYISILYTDH